MPSTAVLRPSQRTSGRFPRESRASVSDRQRGFRSNLRKARALRLPSEESGKRAPLHRRGAVGRRHRHSSMFRVSRFVARPDAPGDALPSVDRERGLRADEFVFFSACEAFRLVWFDEAEPPLPIVATLTHRDELVIGGHRAVIVERRGTTRRRPRQLCDRTLRARADPAAQVEGHICNQSASVVLTPTTRLFMTGGPPR
jgi:hypothetical protein